MDRGLFDTAPGFVGIVLSLHSRLERRKSETENLCLLGNEGTKKYKDN